MIRKFLLSSAAILAVTGSSFAADLPSRRAPPVYVPPVPVFTWTGFYIGGQIGYGFGRDAYNYGAGLVTSAYRPDGVIGGAHVGYNLSSQGLFGNLLGAGGVIGVEGDVNGSSYSRAINVPFVAGVTTGTRIPIDGSIRGRVGFAVDRALFYATGGAAFASLRNSYGVGFVPGLNNTTIGHTRVGYTVGGGIDYAVTNNWSVRAEYRYTDFGAYNDYPATGVTVRHHETENRVQVGFSYKFDTFAPPAAGRRQILSSSRKRSTFRPHVVRTPGPGLFGRVLSFWRPKGDDASH